MRSLKTSAGVLLFLALAAGGCNRGPAEEALVVAEQTLEDAKANLERFAPEKLARLSRALAEARGALAEGRYTEALRVAQELPSQVHRAIAVADRRREAESAASRSGALVDRLTPPSAPEADLNTPDAPR